MRKLITQSALPVLTLDISDNDVPNAVGRSQTGCNKPTGFNMPGNPPPAFAASTGMQRTLCIPHIRLANIRMQGSSLAARSPVRIEFRLASVTRDKSPMIE